MDAPELAIVGRIRKAHGIRGEVVVEPITDAPDAVFAPGRRVFAGTAGGDRARDGAELSVMDARPFKGGLIIRFEQISDRNAAELWRDRYLLLPLSELEPPSGDEVYIHELVGMRVVLVSGEDLGVVSEVYELPQGLALDVARAAGGSVVLSFSPDVVTQVRAKDRIIEVDPPSGMLD
jgi:16S rRNA processing protein RimM